MFLSEDTEIDTAEEDETEDDESEAEEEEEEEVPKIKLLSPRKGRKQPSSGRSTPNAAPTRSSGRSRPSMEQAEPVQSTSRKSLEERAPSRNSRRSNEPSKPPSRPSSRASGRLSLEASVPEKTTRSRRSQEPAAQKRHSIPLDEGYFLL
jgi:hypothetical protein